jgi:HAD superfamily hydrolase (TIGR01457 family)
VASSIWGVYDTLLADLDGVVYEGKNAIEPAPSVIRGLQESGIKVGYVTNNSSRRPETVAEQLAGFGIPTRAEQVIGSAQAGVELLATLIPAGSKVLVVGGEGLRHAVETAGFTLVENSDAEPAGVIQGFAPDVAWNHLAEASYAIQRGAKWVATNQDWTIPREKGMAPGNGTLVSAVHTAVGILPPVAGKPEPGIFHTAVKTLGAKSPLFVGDRIDTDISGANRAGIDSAVVMTGVATRKELLGLKAENRPKFILGDLGELLSKYPEPKATKRGYKCGKSAVELLGNKVRVVDGDPKSLDSLRAACAVIYNAQLPIYALDVEPALYE